MIDPHISFGRESPLNIYVTIESELLSKWLWKHCVVTSWQNTGKPLIFLAVAYSSLSLNRIALRGHNIVDKLFKIIYGGTFSSYESNDTHVRPIQAKQELNIE